MGDDAPRNVAAVRGGQGVVHLLERDPRRDERIEVDLAGHGQIDDAAEVETPGRRRPRPRPGRAPRTPARSWARARSPRRRGRRRGHPSAPARPRMTRTLAPGSAFAVLITAPIPVVTARPTIAALSSGASSRILTAPVSGTTAYSPNEQPRDKRRREFRLGSGGSFRRRGHSRTRSARRARRGSAARRGSTSRSPSRASTRG